ncbi:probable RMD1-protein required for Meiotic Division [Serendipita indica DSM 11827]|uniref:Probable RMD1-protein required for Meiotic Division n=1 Tax=Serendipita indica (strain DSM 11827) TaxID=1109443 RepID=G4T727_SERID|nr:probable RMD1-protein required for Meiotic Division [Serendipita indica DSM 11827]
MNLFQLRSTTRISSFIPRREYIIFSRPVFSVQRTASTNVNKSLPSQGTGKAQDSSSEVAPKPKLNTNLRKTASASLSIREKSTRGAIRPVVTLSTAERYILKPLLKTQKASNATMFAEALWLPVVHASSNRQKAEASEKENERDEPGEAFIFENGCAVFWGIQEDDALRFLNKLVRRNGVELGRYSEEETEEVEFVTDPSERTRLQGDLIILGESLPLSNPEEILPASLPKASLPEDTLAARYAFSEALARSTALSAIETGVEEFLQSVSKLPQTLSSTGRPGLTRTEIIKKMGLLLKFRQRIFLNPQNFTDMPEVYWSEPQLEKYFNQMSDALEIKSRTQLVNAKITYAVELQSVMRELLTEASGHRMELIIIALIAFEATLAFIREGPEIWKMISGQSKEKSSSRH